VARIGGSGGALAKRAAAIKVVCMRFSPSALGADRASPGTLSAPSAAAASGLPARQPMPRHRPVGQVGPMRHHGLRVGWALAWKFPAGAHFTMSRMTRCNAHSSHRPSLSIGTVNGCFQGVCHHSAVLSGPVPSNGSHSYPRSLASHSERCRKRTATILRAQAMCHIFSRRCGQGKLAGSVGLGDPFAQARQFFDDDPALEHVG
jgi:hypothetical protein